MQKLVLWLLNFVAIFNSRKCIQNTAIVLCQSSTLSPLRNLDSLNYVHASWVVLSVEVMMFRGDKYRLIDSHFSLWLLLSGCHWSGLLLHRDPGVQWSVLNWCKLFLDSVRNQRVVSCRLNLWLLCLYLGLLASEGVWISSKVTRSIRKEGEVKELSEVKGLVLWSGQVLLGNRSFLDRRLVGWSFYDLYFATIKLAGITHSISWLKRAKIWFKLGVVFNAKCLLSEKLVVIKIIVEILFAGVEVLICNYLVGEFYKCNLHFISIN